MTDKPRTFIVDVTVEKKYRVTIGGRDGSNRIEEDASDEDAVEVIVHDYGWMQAGLAPSYISLEREDMNIESIREVLEQ